MQQPVGDGSAGNVQYMQQLADDGSAGKAQSRRVRRLLQHVAGASTAAKGASGPLLGVKVLDLTRYMYTIMRHFRNGRH